MTSFFDRWTPQRKQNLLLAIERGEQHPDRAAVSAELADWRQAYAEQGRAGLSVTKRRRRTAIAAATLAILAAPASAQLYYPGPPPAVNYGAMENHAAASRQAAVANVLATIPPGPCKDRAAAAEDANGVLAVMRQCEQQRAAAPAQRRDRPRDLLPAPQEQASTRIVHGGPPPAVQSHMLCPDFATFQTVVNLFNAASEDRMQSAFVGSFATQMRGPDRAKPDLSMWECTVVPAGIELENDGSLFGYRARLSDGRIIAGVTNLGQPPVWDWR